MSLRAGSELPTKLTAILAAGGIGLLGAARPELAVSAACVFSAAVAAWVFPALFFVGLALVAPLQPWLEAFHPHLKVMDEGVMLLFSAATLAVALTRNPRGLAREPVFAALALFGLLGLASVLVSGTSLAQGALGLFVTLDYTVLFAALLVVPVSRGIARAVIATLLTMGVVAVLVALLQHVMGVDALPGHGRFLWEQDLLRVPSVFRHPNDLAYLMLPMVFVGASGWWLRGGWLYPFTTAVGLLGVLLAVSRSSYLAVIAGGAVAVALSGVLSRRVLLAVVVAMLVVGPLMAPGFVSRVEKIQREGGDARLTYARQGLRILEERPWLGVGPGRFGGVVAQRYGSSVHEEFGVRFDSTWKTVDSFWLHLVVESGVLGLVTLVGLLGVVFVRARARLREATGSVEQRVLCLATLMLIPAHLVINTTSMALEANATAAVLWLLAGLALSPGASREGTAGIEARLEGT